MNFRNPLVPLVIVAFFSISLLAGCRGPRFPVPPPIIIDDGYHQRPRHRIKHYRYRYFPGSQVYYDSSRRIYFYFSNNTWLSVPVLPPHIHLDMHNYVTVDLEGPKPHIHHKNVIKRYPPRVIKKQNRQQERREIKRDERKEYRDARDDRRYDKRQDRKEYREDKQERRQDRKEYREERQERREDKREERKDYRDDREDRREDRRERRQEYRDDGDDRRDDRRDRRQEYRDDDDDERNYKERRRQNDRDDRRIPEPPVWR